MIDTIVTPTRTYHLFSGDSERHACGKSTRVLGINDDYVTTSEEAVTCLECILEIVKAIQDRKDVNVI